MKKTLCRLCAPILGLVLITGCANTLPAGSGAAEQGEPSSLSAVQNPAGGEAQVVSTLAKEGAVGLAEKEEYSLPAGLLSSYYAAQNTSAFEYFQNESIQEFVAMWVKEETGDIDAPQWNYDSFAQITVMDHALEVSRPEEALYCCTFSNGVDRYGYLIFKYNEADPSISNWGVGETTPYSYDLEANTPETAMALAKTDIDLATATAARVYLLDRENKRADQAICFIDGKGDRYLGYFGKSVFTIEKWQAEKV